MRSAHETQCAHAAKHSACIFNIDNRPRCSRSRKTVCIPHHDRAHHNRPRCARSRNMACTTSGHSVHDQGTRCVQPRNTVYTITKHGVHTTGHSVQGHGTRGAYLDSLEVVAREVADDACHTLSQYRASHCTMRYRGTARDHQAVHELTTNH
eukprot:620814-Rhodomonas_salina.2